MTEQSRAGASTAAEPASELPRLDLRLLPAAAVAWLLAWAATGFPHLAWWIAGGCGLTVVVALALSRQSRAPRFVRWSTGAIGAIAVAAAAGLLVTGIAGARAESRVPEAIALAASDGVRVELHVVVTSLPKGDAQSIRVRVTTLAADGQAAEAPVLLFLPATEQDASALEIGTELLVEVKLQAVPPGDRVVALAFARDPAVVTAAPNPLLAAGNELRSSFVDLARELPAPGGSLVPGLAVGDERLVDAELDAAMKVSSLTHLTAVSGSNIALIVTVVVGLGRLAGWKRAVRLAAAGAVVAGFVLLVTPQGSVIRATAMALLVLVLDATSRPVQGAPVLSLAVIVLLAADPWLSRDYGFALSAAATAGLLLGTRPLANWLERWLPPPIALLIAVPLAAQLACQPILLLLEPALPLYGVAANLLAAPAAPIATVIGLAACLMAVIAPPLGQVLVWIAWLPAQWIGLIAETATSLPFASIPWLDGALGAAAFILVLVAILLVAGGLGGEQWRRARSVVAVMLSLTLAVIVAVAAGIAATRSRDLPSDWRLVACNVGQGDALLLRAAGATILIDTGEDAALLHDCLSEFGAERIDLLVLSHFDKDHSGALAELRIPVIAAWLPDTKEAREEPDTLRLELSGATLHFGAAGDALAIGDLTLHALSPRPGALGAPSRDEGNDGSLVVHAVPNPECVASCFSTLLLGDVGEEAQRRILRSNVSLGATVVKVSHHGSADQSAEFYAAVGAELGIVSVGENDYGHPRAEALQYLADAGTAWLRTDEHGHLVLFIRDGVLTTWTSMS